MTQSLQLHEFKESMTAIQELSNTLKYAIQQNTIAEFAEYYKLYLQWHRRMQEFSLSIQQIDQLRSVWLDKKTRLRLENYFKDLESNPQLVYLPDSPDSLYYTPSPKKTPKSPGTNGSDPEISPIFLQFNLSPERAKTLSKSPSSGKQLIDGQALDDQIWERWSQVTNATTEDELRTYIADFNAAFDLIDETALTKFAKDRYDIYRVAYENFTDLIVWLDFLNSIEETIRTTEDDETFKDEVLRYQRKLRDLDEIISLARLDGFTSKTHHDTAAYYLEQLAQLSPSPKKSPASPSTSTKSHSTLTPHSNSPLTPIVTPKANSPVSPYDFKLIEHMKFALRIHASHISTYNIELVNKQLEEYLDKCITFYQTYSDVSLTSRFHGVCIDELSLANYMSNLEKMALTIEPKPLLTALDRYKEYLLLAPKLAAKSPRISPVKLVSPDTTKSPNNFPSIFDSTHPLSTIPENEEFTTPTDFSNGYGHFATLTPDDIVPQKLHFSPYDIKLSSTTHSNAKTKTPEQQHAASAKPKHIPTSTTNKSTVNSHKPKMGSQTSNNKIKASLLMSFMCSPGMMAASAFFIIAGIVALHLATFGGGMIGMMIAKQFMIPGACSTLVGGMALLSSVGCSLFDSKSTRTKPQAKIADSNAKLAHNP